MEAVENTGLIQVKAIEHQRKRLLYRSQEDGIESLGFPAELGEAIAKHLGSPKAMERMISYLHYVKSKSEYLVENV